MILFNPHTQDLSVVFEGKTLSVGAGKTVELTDAEGVFWLGIHPFLRVEEKQSPKEPEVAPVKSIKKK